MGRRELEQRGWWQNCLSESLSLLFSANIGSDLDWMEPSMQLCHSRTLQPHAYDQVFNAFDLLRTKPSVQRMVISLSSDKAVWEAVMNNDVVKEIRDLYHNGISQDEESPDGTSGENKGVMDFIKWVFDNTMVKATEVFVKITKVVTELFNTSYYDDGVNNKGKDASQIQQLARGKADNFSPALHCGLAGRDGFPSLQQVLIVSNLSTIHLVVGSWTLLV